MGLLDGKTAIITGSARGIGRATAELFSAEGAQVTINDIDGDIAEQAAGEIKGETVSVAGDLTKPGACDDVVQKTIDAFGKVDILVNNAGYTWDGAAHKMSDEQFQAMLDIHTVVPFRMVRAVAPHMREPAKAERDAGRRCSARSSTSPRSRARWATPARSTTRPGKAGVTGLTKTLAKEWGQFKINVNAIAFGFVETRLTQAKEKGETDRGRRGRARGRDRHPRADAQHGGDDHPARRAGAARGGRRAGPVPGLAALELHPRPGHQRHRRPVRRDVRRDAPLMGRIADRLAELGSSCRRCPRRTAR